MTPKPQARAVSQEPRGLFRETGIDREYNFLL